MLDKLRNAIDSATDVLERVHDEREKRVELEALPQECVDGPFKRIKQGFIREVRKDLKPYSDVRIRECIDKNGKGKEVYTMTAKYRPGHEEAEMTISKDMFDALWPKTSAKQTKNRYSISGGWIVDDIIYPEKRVVAEYEYSETKKSARMPKGFQKKGK